MAVNSSNNTMPLGPDNLANFFRATMAANAETTNTPTGSTTPSASSKTTSLLKGETPLTLLGLCHLGTNQVNALPPIWLDLEKESGVKG